MESSHHQSFAATTFPPPIDAEKAALDSMAADLGVKTRSAAAEKAVNNDNKTRDGVVAAKIATCGDADVRVLTLDEYKEAALSLAEAFKEDHTSLYFTHTPDRAEWSEEQKWQLHLKMMEYITYAHLLKGMVVSAGPNYDCVGLWMPPGENMDDMWTILRSGMWRLSYQLSKEGRKRFFNEFLPLLGDTKAQVMGDRDQDSWYLVYIGTRPSGRGKGYARKVISYVTDIADRDGKACYLESSNAVNLIIYGKMGFELRKHVYLQREMEHVQLDIMVREPKAMNTNSDADSGVDVK